MLDSWISSWTGCGRGRPDGGDDREADGRALLSAGTEESSGSDWTAVDAGLPDRLTNGPSEAAYRVADRLRMKRAPRISRADVAALMHQAAHGSE